MFAAECFDSCILCHNKGSVYKRMDNPGDESSHFLFGFIRGLRPPREGDHLLDCRRFDVLLYRWSGDTGALGS